MTRKLAMAVGEDDQQRHHRDQGSAPCRGAAGGACAAGVLEAAAHSCPRRYRRRLAESTSWQLATDKPGPGVTSHAFDRPLLIARRLWRHAVAGLRSGVGCRVCRTTLPLVYDDEQHKTSDDGMSRRGGWMQA